MNIDEWYIYILTFSLIFFALSHGDKNTLVVLMIIILIYIAYFMNIEVSKYQEQQTETSTTSDNSISYDIKFLQKYDIGRYEELIKNINLFDRIHQKIIKHKIDKETNLLLLQDLYTNRLEILYSYYVMNLNKKDNKRLKSLIKQFRKEGEKILRSDLNVLNDVVPYNFRNTNLMLP